MTYKVHRKQNTVKYKLRDPSTGLYLASLNYIYHYFSHNDESPCGKNSFNSIGLSWASKKTAAKHWANYNFTQLKDKNKNPDLELVMFEIVTTEKERTDIGPDMHMTVMYNEVSKNRNIPRLNKPSNNIVDFVLFMALIHPTVKFNYVLVFRGKLKIPARKFKTKFYQNDELNNIDITCVAIEHDEDLVQLRLEFSDQYNCSWDNNRIEQLYRACTKI